jgi:hypothetical protein
MEQGPGEGLPPLNRKAAPALGVSAPHSLLAALLSCPPAHPLPALSPPRRRGGPREGAPPPDGALGRGAAGPRAAPALLAHGAGPGGWVGGVGGGGVRAGSGAAQRQRAPRQPSRLAWPSLGRRTSSPAARVQEGTTRRLVEHCGLPWDPAFLRFYENERAVQTASQLQVGRGASWRPVGSRARAGRHSTRPPPAWPSAGQEAHLQLLAQQVAQVQGGACAAAGGGGPARNAAGSQLAHRAAPAQRLHAAAHLLTRPPLPRCSCMTPSCAMRPQRGCPPPSRRWMR